MDIITSFINDFKEILKDDIPNNAIFNVHFQRDDIVGETPNDILKNVVSYQIRLVKSPVIARITIRNSSETLYLANMSFTISEFPNCCGKAILYSTKMYSTIVKQDPVMNFTLPTQTYISVIKRIFQLIDELMVRMHYSSYDFILSDIENKQLFGIIEKVGFACTGSFRNRRNSYEHTCYSYHRNIRELSLSEIQERYSENKMSIYER